MICGFNYYTKYGQSWCVQKVDNIFFLGFNVFGLVAMVQGKHEGWSGYGLVAMVPGKHEGWSGYVLYSLSCTILFDFGLFLLIILYLFTKRCCKQ